MFLLLTDGDERETFVFVPSRTAEVIGLKGTLKWTQGEESFYFVYYSMLVLLCLPNMEFHGVCGK